MAFWGRGYRHSRDPMGSPAHPHTRTRRASESPPQRDRVQNVSSVSSWFQTRCTDTNFCFRSTEEIGQLQHPGIFAVVTHRAVAGELIARRRPLFTYVLVGCPSQAELRPAVVECLLLSAASLGSSCGISVVGCSRVFLRCSGSLSPRTRKRCLARQVGAEPRFSRGDRMSCLLS